MTERSMTDTLSQLAAVIETRKGAAPDSSYVASLYHKGLNKILEKVGEESIETILAAKDAAVDGESALPDAQNPQRVGGKHVPRERDVVQARTDNGGWNQAQREVNRQISRQFQPLLFVTAQGKANHNRTDNQHAVPRH